MSDELHAFISYVREDSKRADWLERRIDAVGIKVWRDVHRLSPGDNWKRKIREAISEGSLAFLACFSESSTTKVRSYQREELALAAGEFRLRPTDRAWLIPIRFEPVSIPSIDLGIHGDLQDYNWVDLFGPAADANLNRLIEVMNTLGSSHRESSDTAERTLLDSVAWGKSADPALKPILKRLVAQKSDTATDLASALGLQTAHAEKALQDLRARGWVVAAQADSSRTTYRINSKAGLFVGVAVEHNLLTTVLCDLGGQVLHSTRAALANSTREDVTAAIVESAEAEMHSRRGRDPIQLLGIGITLSGLVSHNDGSVIFAPDLQSDTDSWTNYPLVSELETRLKGRVDGLPGRIVVESAVNALAISEYHVHGGAGSILLVLLGPGSIRTSFVINGVVLHGANSAAGEGSHIVVDSFGPECPAGFPHRGCLESVATAQSILRSLGLRSTNFDQISASVAANDELVRAGDLSSARPWTVAGDRVGRFLSSMLAVLDPEKVVIYGSDYMVKDGDFAVAQIFRQGVQGGLQESHAAGFTSASRVEWRSIDSERLAAAASAAAVDSFIRSSSLSGQVDHLRNGISYT